MENNYIRRTKRTDKCECIYCHNIWGSKEVCHEILNEGAIRCPKCGQRMGVDLSINFSGYEINRIGEE